MEDRSPQILSVAVLFLCLTWISVGLRIYVRTRIIKAFGLDDSTMLLALAFFTSYAICQLGGIAHGTGKHRSQLTDQNAEIALRYWFFCEIFYTLSTSTLKVAIGFFLLRITITPAHVWIIRIIMIASAACGVAYCCVVTFQCHPISYWWDLDTNHHGTCIAASFVADVTYVVSALNAVADWVFGTLPIFIVKDLQMKRSAKVMVVSILGFAALGSTATIVRFPYLWTLKEYKGDFLWRTSDVAIWTTVEVGVGITAGCIATLKPLMKPFFRFLGIRTATSRSSGRKWTTKRGRSGVNGRSGKPTYSEQALDNLRPNTDKVTTTTTVVGLGKSAPKGLTSWADRTERSSEEYIIQGGSHPIPIDYYHDTIGWKNGISKSVEVRTTEEREVTGSGDPSSLSTEEERGLPAKVFERI